MDKIQCQNPHCQKEATQVIRCTDEWSTTSHLLCEKCADAVMSGFSCLWHGDDGNHTTEERSIT